MHPAPSLLEVYSKKNNESRTSQQQPMSAAPDRPERPSSVDPQSPPLRKGTGGSTSTAVSAVSVSTVTSASTGGTGFTPIESAGFTSANHNSNHQHSVFDSKETEDGAPNRRASRRRTGPLSPEQRQKAALIRKIGACDECKRRRVACQLGHHNLTEEEARKKYMPRSSPPELPPLAGRPTSAGTGSSTRQTYVGELQPMDIDLPPGQLPLPRLSASDARNRTPLPSGRSLEKLASAALPGMDSLKLDPLKADLQAMATRIMGSRSRYTAANVLLVTWEDEVDKDVPTVVKELADVFKHSYQYSCESVMIPTNSESSPSLWLQKRLVDFMSQRDSRESLKIVYYNGHSHLDGNRKMVITSPARTESPCVIQWAGIQQAMEDACSDTLCIMDAPYFASAPTSRQKGLLELLAAANSQEHSSRLGRTTFSRALTEELRSRVAYKRGTSAAELHANLLGRYANIVHDQAPEKQPVTSFPSPLYLQRSGNPTLPSIQLSPLNGRRSLPQGPEADLSSRSIEIVLQADRNNIPLEAWNEWLRQMPEGILNIKIERPLGNDTLR